jgi:rsbT co-antagonist protein RsbR
METLLAAIARDRASVVIVDVTGVPVVDSDVVDHLLKAIRAASLLGARCVLAGISPVVAQTMVRIGVDLGDIVTSGDLGGGVAYALRLLGLGIRPINLYPRGAR